MVPGMVPLRILSLAGKNKVRQYEPLVPLSGHFSNKQKISMLQTAVHPLQEHCQVRATAALLKAPHTKRTLIMMHIPLCYYLLLLIMIAST
jgi:hypothetical protein